jgi:muramoyltetrapeptide carboxypeptidase LdcA involved in peptidoglycan recycling
MIKTIGIVSLSRGILGEDFMEHEVEIGLRRLNEMGLVVKFMPNALKGVEYIEAHPEKRAEDLLAALKDPGIDMILCAIGGDDTYRLAPYLFDNDELAEAANDKIFLGFSDTTLNHFMLHKVGMKSFYGQAFLPDICELSPDMLPYTRQFFEELIKTGRINMIFPSHFWYEQRTSFGPDQRFKSLPMYEDKGFQLIQGPSKFSGKILGGCIDSMYDMFDGERYSEITEKYNSICISYDGWSCRYMFDGVISDTGRIAANRNGYYKIYNVAKMDQIRIKVEITKNV